MRMKLRVVLFSFLLVGIGSSSDAEIVDIIGPLIDSLIGQPPSNENGMDSQFEHRALHDHSNDEIYDSTSQQIIERSGYEQKSYNVVSDDGYITELINIINPLADQNQLKQPPVMLFHGGITDSSVWIFVNAIQHYPERYPRDYAQDGPITSYNRSLAFTLANNGYDVWLVGTRGSNKQNLGHTKYEVTLLEDLFDKLAAGDLESIETSGRGFINSFKYFDYSMDEIVDYEIPKQIGAVLQYTGSKKVSVVGLSLSTSVLFKVLVSDKGLANKIHSYAAVLPLLNSEGTNAVVGTALSIFPKVPQPIGTLFTELILSKQLRAILRKLSRYGTYKQITRLVTGSSAKYTTSLEDPFVGHVFLSTGFKEIQHFAQETTSGRLQRFDHGPLRNAYIYGSHEPSTYDLSQFKLKRWMIVSNRNDVIGTQSSVDQYLEQIPVEPYKVIRNTGFNHIDGVAAFENDVDVNLPILEFFEKFQTINQLQTDYADADVGADVDVDVYASANY